jgi:hypothetical protein
MPLKDEKALPPEPWHSFLKELDALAIGTVDFQCMGGFVVTQLYGLNRSTGDLNVLSIAPVEQRKELLEKAGRCSALHKKYKIYLDYVGVASIPYEYESRLVEMYPGVYRRIRLFALDPYDIALSKLCRNIARDREDVRHLANQVPFDLQLLRRRYTDELRPDLLGVPENQDAILNLWIEMIEQDRQSDLKNQ